MQYFCSTWRTILSFWMFLLKLWSWRTTLDWCRASLILFVCYPAGLPRWWRWWTTLDCEMPKSPDTLQVLIITFAFLTLSTASECTFLTLFDHRDFCFLSQISWTIWLVYCDQLSLSLSHKKCFWLFRRRYGTVRLS